MQQQAQGQIFLHHREGEVLLRRSQDFMGDTRSLLMGRMTRNDHSNDFTATQPWIQMVNKGKHPQKAEQLSEILQFTQIRSLWGPKKKFSALPRRTDFFWPDNHDGPQSLIFPAGKAPHQSENVCRVVSKHWLANCFLMFHVVCLFFLLQGLIQYKSRISLTYKHT